LFHIKKGGEKHVEQEPKGKNAAVAGPAKGRTEVNLVRKGELGIKGGPQTVVCKMTCRVLPRWMPARKSYLGQN